MVLYMTYPTTAFGFLPSTISTTISAGDKSKLKCIYTVFFVLTVYLHCNLNQSILLSVIHDYLKYFTCHGRLLEYCVWKIDLRVSVEHTNVLYFVIILRDTYFGSIIFYHIIQAKYCKNVKELYYTHLIN